MSVLVVFVGLGGLTLGLAGAVVFSDKDNLIGAIASFVLGVGLLFGAIAMDYHNGNVSFEKDRQVSKQLCEANAGQFLEIKGDVNGWTCIPTSYLTDLGKKALR